MKRSDAQIDHLLRESLEDVRPPSDDSQFLAGLRWRIEMHESRSPFGGLRVLVLGFAGAATLCLTLGTLALYSLRTAPPIPASPTAREEMARFAAEHEGEAMVLQINEHRGSRLFVATPDRAPSTDSRDLSLPAAGDTLSLRGSGWIQTRRVTPPDQSS
ncbi:hypothetical protein JXA47_02730 [Candidatus Sumerlaeota bacterium]|nr:hypothetical protein [Candidatus Sumerlaeota bacterium]